MGLLQGRQVPQPSVLSPNQSCSSEHLQLRYWGVFSLKLRSIDAISTTSLPGQDASSSVECCSAVLAKPSRPERLKQPYRKRTAEIHQARKVLGLVVKSLLSLSKIRIRPDINVTGFHAHQIMSALYVLLSLLWASCVAFGSSDSIDATTKATPNLVIAAATASTSSSKPPRTTSTRSFDDASLSRAKESYQSSFYASLHGSGTTLPTTSYST